MRSNATPTIAVKKVLTKMREEKVISFKCRLPVSTRGRFDAVTTLLTSKKRCYSVKTTSCAYYNIKRIRIYVSTKYGNSPFSFLWHFFCFLSLNKNRALPGMIQNVVWSSFESFFYALSKTSYQTLWKSSGKEVMVLRLGPTIWTFSAESKGSIL